MLILLLISTNPYLSAPSLFGRKIRGGSMAVIKTVLCLATACGIVYFEWRKEKQDMLNQK
jgi:hypothetical protein